MYKYSFKNSNSIDRTIINIKKEFPAKIIYWSNKDFVKLKNFMLDNGFIVNNFNKEISYLGLRHREIKM